MSTDTRHKTLDRNITLHPDHTVAASRQAHICRIAATSQDLKIIRSNMSVRTQNGAHSFLEKMQQCLLFTARLGMHINHNMGDTL